MGLGQNIHAIQEESRTKREYWKGEGGNGEGIAEGGAMATGRAWSGVSLVTTDNEVLEPQGGSLIPLGLRKQQL